MLPMQEICPETARKDRAPKGACPPASGAGQHGVPPILMAQMGYQPGAWALAEFHSLIQTAGSNGLAQRIHIRVLRLKPSLAPTGIGNLRGRPGTIVLDQWWNQIAHILALRRKGHAPGKPRNAHGAYLPGMGGTKPGDHRFNGWGCRNIGNQLRLRFQREFQRGIIQIKGPGMGRRALGGVGGDDFDILVGPKAEQHIMRANARMCPARNRARAQMPFQPGGAGFQRGSANYQMINLSHITPQSHARLCCAADTIAPN